MAVESTTNPQRTAPPAADGVSVTPSAVAWTWSAWFEVDPSTAVAWMLSGLSVTTDGVGAVADVEFQVGVGAVGVEVVVDKFRARYVDRHYCSHGYIPRPILLGDSRIPLGSRVSVRMRKAGTTTTDWRLALTYYESPIVGTLTSSDQPQQTYPDGAANVQLTTDGGSGWVPSSWTSLWTPSTAIAVVGATTSGSSSINNQEWQVDLGIGATPVRFGSFVFRVGLFSVGGPAVIPFWAPYRSIPAGSLVSARATMGSGYSSGFHVQFSLVYMELPL